MTCPCPGPLLRQAGWLLLLLALSAAACGPHGASMESRYWLSLRDGDGQAVRLAGTPERIVAVGPAQAELLLALGLAGKFVATHELGPPPPEDGVARISGAPPPVQEVLEFIPDLVVGPAVPSGYRAALAHRGVAYLAVQPRTPEEVAHALRLLGAATGRYEEGRRRAEELERRLAGLVELAAQRRAASDGGPPRVYVEYGYRDGQVLAAAPGSFADSLIRAVGARNALDGTAGDGGEGLLPEKRAVESAPDVVLAVHPHMVTGMWTGSRPGWQEVPAVREGRLFAVEAAPFLRPGVRFPEAMEELIGLLYDS